VGEVDSHASAGSQDQSFRLVLEGSAIGARGVTDLILVQFLP